MVKECKKCKQIKPLADFYFRKETGKYRGACKKCKSIRTKDEVLLGLQAKEKVCKLCGIKKEISEYNKSGKWVQPYCKPCDSDRKKNYYKNNYLKTRESHKKYYQEKKDKIKSKVNQYRELNIEVIKEKKKNYRKNNLTKINEKRKIFEEKNRERLSAERKLKRPLRADKVREYLRKRNKTDVCFRLAKNIRSRIRWALKRWDISKSEKSENLLGCDILTFKNYFSSLFTEGMTWDKFMNGEIHIDHIIPCKYFNLTIIEEQKKCFHYTNTQPLWELDNLRKGASFNKK